MEDLRIYQIALTFLPAVGPKTAKALTAYNGGIEAVFSKPAGALMKTPGVGELIARKIVAARQEALLKARKELDFALKNKLTVRFFTDDDYPFLLKQIPDAPVVFFQKGDLDFNERRTLSIVGTRKASVYGKSVCEELIEALAESGSDPIIISGLAYGIDICAHRAALKYGLDTAAVFGHGFDRVYPAAHQSTARQMESKGALLSEFPSNAPFERQNFLKRNRIIAGISEATLVVESALKGGSLVTAEIANSYHREVFAFPGRVGDSNSAGCNALIKKHKAYMIESHADIEYILGWNVEHEKNTTKNQRLFVELTADEKKIVQVVKEQGKPMIDDICKHTGLTPASVSAILLELEFKGIVKNLPGKVFELSKKIHF